MRRLLLLSAVLLAAMPPTHASQGRSAAPAFIDAYTAWDEGDYAVSLERLRALVPGADEKTFEQIALLTGELYQTREITPDGRAPTLSPDGTLIAFETGPANATQIRIVRNAAGFPVVDEFPGRAALIAPDSLALLYQTADTPVALRVRVLGTKRDLPVDTGGLTLSSLTWSHDGHSLYAAAAETGVTDRTDLYALTPNAAARRLTDSPGRKTGIRVTPGGAALLYVIGGPAGRGGGQGSPATFGYLDLRSGEASVIEGASAPPVFSADGGTIAYIARDGATSRLMIRSGRAPATAVMTTNDRVDAPALSPDGSRIAFQRMLRDDWEIFVSDREGKDVRRVTRDIQHDILPRFLTNDRLLGLIGEARHRRSYLYDLKTGERQRLFHNNTVRTIAPEYIWDVSRDSNFVMVQADRDGNTVSPERGVYVVDLTKRISRADLTARIDASLAAERGLRGFAARVTKPLAAAIRQVVDRASVTRVFGYEKALFDFDSKHISQPGNLKASEYLHATYASFGYTPEYQWFEPRDQQGTARALGGKTANVIATLRGTVHPDVIYVVSSHYDSVAAGPGADDDSSGTAALLEAARIMAGHPQPATIVFASFTGEEAGLLGSREFVRRTSQEKWNVVGALNNDMIGWANDHRLDNTIRYSNPGIKDIQHAVALTFTDLITYDALYYRSTDAQAFYDAWGDTVGGIGSYPVLGNPHYHQPHDWLETINHQLVTEVGKTTAATLMVLANSPSRLRGLTAKASGTGAALTWQPSPERDVRQYVVTWQPKGGAAQRLVVTSPSATIPNAPAGTDVRVRAVNARGLEGWDAARTIVQ